MVFVLNYPKLKYELEKLTRLFLPFEKIVFTDEETSINNDNFIIVEVKDSNIFVKLNLDGKTQVREKSIDYQPDFTEIERTSALMLFDCFYKVTGYRSPWGILTGVRPAKLMGKLIKNEGLDSAINYFKHTLLVDDDKTKLCLMCNQSEESIIKHSTYDSFSLYVSIPFCPSRCSYCSFVSHSVEQAKKLMPSYVKLICDEIKTTGEIANKIGLKLKTVYIGGGTPTALSADDITTIMSAISFNFDLSGLLEYTVEAGRPDTVTREKLLAIKQGGATRISINPQTMNDEVLKLIGRRHTVNEFINAFNLARSVGFNNINVDLIAGLNGDNFEGFKKSVDEVLKLSPENITVHSLSMKRASNLNKCGTVFDINQGVDAANMVNYAFERLNDAGIVPYYMYRQSKTIGNLENVGYAKKGYECLYNVYIMDETHSILACGASAVTKLREPNGSYIERIFNYKYPYEYIEKFDEILQRKNGIISFYDKYRFD